MRGQLVLIIGIIFFGYGVSRPLDPPASKAPFAELPAVPKAVEPPKPSVRPKAARLARAPGPLDVTRQAQQQPASKQATAPSSSPSVAKQSTEILTAAAIAAFIIAASRKAYQPPDVRAPVRTIESGMVEAVAVGARTAGRAGHRPCVIPRM
jgi:hypothetical protein